MTVSGGSAGALPRNERASILVAAMFDATVVEQVLEKKKVQVLQALKKDCGVYGLVAAFEKLAAVIYPTLAIKRDTSVFPKPFKTRAKR